MLSTITLDLETSIHNKGNPFDTRNFVVSVHSKVEEAPTVCSFFTHADFLSDAKRGLDNASLVIGCHIKFDIHWLRNLGVGLRNSTRVWDIAIAEYILSGQTVALAGLNDLAAIYGLGVKEPLVAEYWERGISTEDIPRDIVEAYGNHDVDLTYAVYLRQMTDPRMTPEIERLIRLSGLDLLVLADMEWNGFKYDVQGSNDKAEGLSTELAEIEIELDRFSPKKINWDSGDQLSCFLYGGTISEDVYIPTERIYKSGPRKGEAYVRNEFKETVHHRFEGYFAPIKNTELAKSTPEKPFWSTAEPVLLKLKARGKESKRIITLLLRRAYLSKLISTYLSAMPALILEMNWKDNLIHGQFNQTIARTGRLSSSKPNMQNAPEEVDEFFVTRYAS